MTAKHLATAGLAALTLALAILSARSFKSLDTAETFGARHYRLNERLGACGKTIECSTLSGVNTSGVGKAEVDLTGCAVNRTEEMRFRASWPHAAGSAAVFTWSTKVYEDGVFPLNGIVAQFIHCDDSSERYGGRPGALVELEIEPAGFAWLAPAADDVFVPFDGEATLDFDGPATATLDAPADAARAPSVTIHVTPIEEAPRAYERLRVGQRFRWDRRQAMIVRIVEPRSPIAGWVEVALPDPEESGIGQR